MKHMILYAISDHFLMLWLQKDYLDTVDFRTFRGGRGGHRFRTFSKILPIVFGGFPYNIFVVLYNQDVEIFA